MLNLPRFLVASDAINNFSFTKKQAHASHSGDTASVASGHKGDYRLESGECSVCFTFHTQCLACPSGSHRFCFDDLDHLVLSVCQEHQGRGLAHLDGKIRCPFEQEPEEEEDDPSVFSLIALERVLMQDTFQVLKQYQTSVAIARQQKLREERAAKAHMEATPEYNRTVKYIHDEILTNRCPSCHAAWYDFDGCSRIQCDNCKRYFCAFCGQRVYLGLHLHVKYCKYNPHRGDEFCSGAKVMEIIRQRKVHALEQYLQTLSSELRERVMNDVHVNELLDGIS